MIAETRKKRKGVLFEILESCLQIDELAVEIYQRFAADSPAGDLRRFWEELTVEEKDHVGVWEKMLMLAELNILPQVFDQPFIIRDKLAGILARSRERFGEYCRKPEAHQAFLVATELEFQMLHEAFLTLIHYYNQLTDSEIEPLDYRRHITMFIEGTRAFNPESPDLQLLMQSIESMFNNVQALVEYGRTDSLTGLINRRGFLATLSTHAYLAQRNSYAMAVLLIDVDELKRLNDEHGFAVGDRVLQVIAEKLSEDVRHSDLLGRYEGDCFAMALSRVTAKSVPKVVETIRRRVELETAALGAPATVSIGAVYGKFRRTVDTNLPRLIETAEQNLRKAKSDGTNRIVVTGIPAGR